MRGSGHTVKRSYALPFILVGVLFYLIGSLQGSAEALRTANVQWHFTHFTVAHSHMTMYGFVAMLIWGGMYGLLPRLPGREPSHLAVGIHFWFALIGVIIYGVSLMIGGHLQGGSWMAGDPFIESVRLMAPWWIWRAVGGSLMMAAHVAFAINLWKMLPRQAAQPAAATGAEVSHGS